MMAMHPPSHGHLGPKPAKQTYKVMIIDDKPVEIHKVVVHSFTVGDVEDPEIYAAEPLCNWEQSEAGRWVIERAIETPEWHQQLDFQSYSYKFNVTAKLKDPDYIMWLLKFK
jgi:hypothetical protein